MKNALRIIDTTSRLIEESNSIARDLIAKRAYEKWQQRGCPLGEDEQDWFVAQGELEAEARDRAQRTGAQHVA